MQTGARDRGDRFGWGYKLAVSGVGWLLLGMGVVLGGAPLYEAPLDSRSAADAKLVGKPTVVRAANGWRIAFAVSSPVDVEVAILGADGVVVRHLAAGLLGPHAPEPILKNKLAQALFWDGRDDRGRPLPDDGARRVRIRVGMQPRLEKTIGRNPDALGNIMALTVGADGELYVLSSTSGPASYRRLLVLGRDGRYRRTIMPYSAQTPAERTESVGHLTLDGERVPIVYNGHSMTLYPLIPNMPQQVMAWNPKGHLVAAGATDSAFEFGLPRHLLAFHPQGGAPQDVPFVGPEINVPLGLVRGLGRSLYQRFEALVCSPDGKFIYYTGGDTRLGSDNFYAPSRHAVFRFRWDEDKGEGMEAPFYGTDSRAGHENWHLNEPRGLAVDKDGNLYICDRNNARVVIVSPAGKFLGKFPVRDPEQIAVHPQTGAIYVLSRQRRPDWLRKDQAPMFMPEYTAWRARAKARWEADQASGVKRRPTRLAKYSPWASDRVPSEITGVEQDFDLMALDAGAQPARIWVAVGGRLERLADRGATLEPDPTGVYRGEAGLVRPGHLVADPERNRVLVFDRTVKSVDIATGRVSEFASGLRDMDRAPDGSLYVVRGNKLQRLDADGNRLPLGEGGPLEADIGPFGPLGDPGRSLTVAPNGDIYLMRIAGQYGVQNRVAVFGPDGKVKQEALVDGLGIGDAGIGVDARGNLYLGVNVKPASARLPAAFRGKVPEGNWLTWVKWTHQFRGAPWYYSMRNEYLYHYGSVMKFGPEGGAMYGRSPGLVEPFLQDGAKANARGAALFENAPAEAPEYRSGYLYHRIRVAGAQWRFSGTGIVPASERYWGDPACVCMYSRLDADPYGRVFAPDCFQFGVHVLDANGNRIGRVGRYGNADDSGPAIHFAWPAYVHFGADGKLYTTDSLSQQITIVGLDYAAAVELALDRK
jgi:hypothetical protein